MMTDPQVWPDEAISPGETLAETLEAVGMSQVELARRANRPPQVISEIVQGKKGITAETAIELEHVLGVPAHMWLNLEGQYRMVRARLAEAKRLQDEVPLASEFPYSEMMKLGWVPKLTDKRERADALLRFFSVATLKKVEHVATWRRAKLRSVSDHALAAWLRRGEIEARAIPTGPFEETKAKELVLGLRDTTRQRPEQFHPKLVEALAAVGIALVCVPHLPRTGAHGATRWAGGRAIVQLSVRYRWADIFWFTLFHELGHVLRHGRRELFVDFSGQADNDAQEEEANRFAAAHLIPEQEYRRFVAGRRLLGAADVQSFADQIGVQAGVVVGRLQHDGRIARNVLNHLREKYDLEHP